MRFPTPLVRGRLIRRYKRFLADVILDSGEEVTASCPNTGSMLGLAEPGAAVWLSESESGTRKYRHTWELVETEGENGATHLVGINTGLPNKIIAEAIRDERIKSLGGFASLRREVRYGVSSRIDILLEDPAKGRCWVEIKNVHLLREPGLAEFPDCATARGVKHLEELTAMAQQGDRAVMLFIIQRPARQFSIAADLDPAYGEAFPKALAAGVEAIAYRCRLSPEEIALDCEVPILS